jgi:uncharacterized protein (DUF362 family)
MKSNVYLRRASHQDPDPAIRELLEALRWREIVGRDSSVVIKPNLCTERPEQIHTANTSLCVLRGVCEVLFERTSHITVVESNGSRYPAQAAFENTGVYRLAAEMGLGVLNLSNDKLVDLPDPRMKGFGMSRTWLEADVFITLPVLKTHATTVFTGALKNQWGCIPRYDRIVLHKYLHQLIGDINKLRPVSLALMDGLVGMQGRGPINGYPIDLNVLLASRDPVALDATAMRLIGLEPCTSRHLMHAHRIGLGTFTEEDVLIDGPFADLKTSVEPALEDWAIKLMNWIACSPFLTRQLLLNDGVFYPLRRLVMLMRSLAKQLSCLRSVFNQRVATDQPLASEFTHSRSTLRQTLGPSLQHPTVSTSTTPSGQ